MITPKKLFVVRGSYGTLHVDHDGFIFSLDLSGPEYADITKVDLPRLFKEDPAAKARGECDILDVGYWYKKGDSTQYEAPGRVPDPTLSGPSFISIDIETLDTTPTAVILSIGVVIVVHGEVTEEHELSTGDVFHQLMQGRTISEDTVDWWRDTKQARARKAIEKSGSLFSALQELTEILPDLKIWARGPQFDQVLLEHAFRQNKLPIPWKYNQWRDERTLEAMFPNAPELPWPDIRIPHVAVDDAWYQAHRVLQLHTLIKQPGVTQ